jgi:hypothetical protein
MTDRTLATRRVEIPPVRLAAWIESFAERHGGALVTDGGDDAVTFTAADGATARCAVPFPPLPEPGLPARALDVDPLERARQLAAHATAERTVGVLLVRLGGYAAGVFTGTQPVLAASKVGNRQVHGRSAAGGQSQARFARRREKQAHEALGEAAEKAAAVFAPYQLDAVVLGGDRRTLARLRNDVRLARYFALAVEQFLTVPDPRLTVLRDTPRLFRAIRISLTEPA